MLTVGYVTRAPNKNAGDPIYECPKCGYNTSGPYGYERLAPERSDE
jgi:hypothetical protein